jgi:hypothetical protein
VQQSRALEAVCAESDETLAAQRARIDALERQLRDNERKRAAEAAEAARAAALAAGPVGRQGHGFLFYFLKNYVAKKIMTHQSWRRRRRSFRKRARGSTRPGTNGMPRAASWPRR